jgi:hypothetical protein
MRQSDGIHRHPENFGEGGSAGSGGPPGVVISMLYGNRRGKKTVLPRLAYDVAKLTRACAWPLRIARIF